MKEFRCWRYRCDFCKKNTRQKAAMVRHEIRCTANPNRQCQFHKYVSRDPAPSVAEMVAFLESHYNDGDYGLKALREYVCDCLPCILSALRASGLCKGYADEEGFREPKIGREQFDFKKELEEFWIQAREDEREASAYVPYDAGW